MSGEALAVGTTLQNRASGRFLTGFDWNVMATEMGDQSTPALSRYWNVLENNDNSIALRNIATERYVDGDGGSEDWDVDESLRLLFDDGWFITRCSPPAQVQKESSEE